MSVYIPNALPAIALNYDNEVALQPLSWYDKKLFVAYRKFVETTYTAYNDRALLSNRHYKAKGLPQATWKFPLLSKDEVNWVLTFFFTPYRETRKVTIRTLDTEDKQWYNYNALFDKPKFFEFYSEGWYRDIVFEFREMVKL